MSHLAAIASWIAFPIYVWQGLNVRRRSRRMYPAKGPVRHVINGRGQPIRLLVVGDSSAASVGIDHSDQGLAARLSQLLAARTARPVIWRAAGFNSATSGQLRDHVIPNLAAEDWTHIVVAVGTNDAKNFHTVRRFRREFGGLLYALRAKWPEAVVVWSPVIEMHRVPALPRGLGQILEMRAHLINETGTRLCLERGAVPAQRLAIIDAAVGFSADGFHASAAGYEAWAEHLVPYVLDGGTPMAAAALSPS